MATVAMVIEKLLQSSMMVIIALHLGMGGQGRMGSWMSCHGNQHVAIEISKVHIRWSYNYLFTHWDWVWQVWETLKENIAIFVDM